MDLNTDPVFRFSEIDLDALSEEDLKDIKGYLHNLIVDADENQLRIALDLPVAGYDEERLTLAQLRSLYIDTYYNRLITALESRSAFDVWITNLNKNDGILE